MPGVFLLPAEKTNNCNSTQLFVINDSFFFSCVKFFRIGNQAPLLVALSAESWTCSFWLKGTIFKCNGLFNNNKSVWRAWDKFMFSLNCVVCFQSVLCLMQSLSLLSSVISQMSGQMDDVETKTTSLESVLSTLDTDLAQPRSQLVTNAPFLKKNLHESTPFKNNKFKSFDAKVIFWSLRGSDQNLNLSVGLHAMFGCVDVMFCSPPCGLTRTAF